MSWQSQAACKDADPADFYASSEEHDRVHAYATARAICATCPVTDECLAYALDRADPHGMWGGTTPTERRKLRRRMPGAPQARAVAPCGTQAAYRRHLRKGEPVDDLCQEAKRRRLTSEAVAQIRAARASTTATDLAETYGVAASTIRTIWRGAAWKQGVAS